MVTLVMAMDEAFNPIEVRLLGGWFVA